MPCIPWRDPYARTGTFHRRATACTHFAVVFLNRSRCLLFRPFSVSRCGLTRATSQPSKICVAANAVSLCRFWCSSIAPSTTKTMRSTAASTCFVAQRYRERSMSRTKCCLHSRSIDVEYLYSKPTICLQPHAQAYHQAPIPRVTVDTD